jgi:alkanesulfonate monooxygenase SsuD/methylene tetrahydromethanopterin reductase-like flavin-dependent oxidoreductase (luciferase family)
VLVRFGIHVAIVGQYAEPGLVVEVARAAEAAGWEALFVWDHLAWAWDVPSADPWVVLAAAAQATARLRLGTAVTPLPRRRPAVVASAVATLDRLSGGRVIFGAGAGGVAAEFTAFGEPDGARVRAAMLDEGLEVIDAPGGDRRAVVGPARESREPVLPDRRVLGCDDEQGRMVVPPARIAAGAEAGATWWLEHIHGRRGSHASMLERISAGPPA